MPDIYPLQLGAPPSIGNGARSSFMLVQHKDAAVHPASDQSRRGEICLMIQDHLASSASFSSLNSAVECFNASVTQDRQDLLIDKHTDVKTLLRAAQEDLKRRFSAKSPPNKRTQMWRNIKTGLEKFCQVVYHYSSVMDVLVSAHPEIAALAWGAMKFLLAVSVNHQELKGKILYHLAEIGEQFKIVDSYVRLFSEADMVEHVCGVYDNFNQFLRLSIEWCKENTLVKFFKNVALPYEARIKPTIDELNNYMKKVKERVDVHNTHRLAVMQYDVSTLIDGLDEHRRLQVDSYAVITRLLQGIASDKLKEIDHPVEPTPSDTCDRIRDGVSCEISNSREIFSTPLPTLSNLQLTFEHFKDSAIQTVQLEAHHSYLALDLPNKPEVQAWLRSQKSALLWIDGYANSRASKWTTEFSVDVLLGAERQNSTVLFYFGDIATDDVAEASSSYLASPKAIIHSFIAQLLRQHASLAGNDAGWKTPERWTEARRSTRAAWTLLHHLLQSLSSKERIIYLIIDSVDALSSVHNHSHNLEPLLRRLSTLVTSSPSSENKGPNTCLATKVLLTSVAGSAHSLLFPANAASIPSSHYVAHIPQTFGQHNVALAPSHLRKPTAKRLVRLPDSDDEIGLKRADSFGFSDDEENGSLVFSSEEEMENCQGVDDGTKKAGREVCMRDKMAQHSPRKMNGKSVRSNSESSQELVFSDDERDDAGKRRGDADDIEFSSSSEEDLTISPR